MVPDDTDDLVGQPHFVINPGQQGAKAEYARPIKSDSGERNHPSDLQIVTRLQDHVTKCGCRTRLRHRKSPISSALVYLASAPPRSRSRARTVPGSTSNLFPIFASDQPASYSRTASSICSGASPCIRIVTPWRFRILPTVCRAISNRAPSW